MSELPRHIVISRLPIDYGIFTFVMIWPGVTKGSTVNEDPAGSKVYGYSERMEFGPQASLRQMGTFLRNTANGQRRSYFMNTMEFVNHRILGSSRHLKRYSEVNC